MCWYKDCLDASVLPHLSHSTVFLSGSCLREGLLLLLLSGSGLMLSLFLLLRFGVALLVLLFTLVFGGCSCVLAINKLYLLKTSSKSSREESSLDVEVVGSSKSSVLSLSVSLSSTCSALMGLSSFPESRSLKEACCKEDVSRI